HHGDSSKTIYELIKESKYTQRFAKLVDEHDGIKALLSDTEKKNHTLFVPTDRAFEHIPPHREPPPKEFILALLKYHIVPGRYPVGRVLASHTIPTELASRALGDRPQRLRVGLTLFGVHLNFYSKVVATDIVAKNGIIHAVGAILVPPPPQSKLIRLLPGRFSTLSLALETTGLGEELDKVKEHATGGTVFAPTNHAFARLGRRANAFLFSEHGKKYLRALLRYHVVANETLYSDAYYKRKDDDGEDNDDDANTELSSSDTDYWHVDLPSLLGDKAIHIDVRRWKRFISIIINGHVRVSVQDGVARDGVIQVVDSVLIPPHKHHDHDHDGHDGGDDDDDSDKDSNGGISVDELRARLGPYVD
ncbi:Fasciclin domain-containing protein, partial [Bombardia bombarda]